MSEKIGLEGVFDISQFSQGVAQYMGAIGKMSGVTTLAQNAINAFGQIGIGALREIGAMGMQALGQAAQAMGQFSAEVLTAAAANSPLVDSLAAAKQGLIEVTAVSFAPLFDQLNSMVQRAAPAFLGVMQAAQTYLGGIAQNAFAWGENITAQFANGMMAAIGAIFDALASIGNAIAGMLMPGSPPALLPNLDTWGTEAAQVYLDAWGQADYGIFNQIGSTIANLIRSFPVPKGGEAGVVGAVIGSRQAIAQATEELRAMGTITNETMGRIAAATGSAAHATTEYIMALVASTNASKAVQDAQEQVNRLTAEYDALLRPIEDELAGIDEAQRQLAEAQRISQLELVENDPNATLAEKEMARLEIQKIRAQQNQRALAAEKKAELETAGTALNAAKKAEQQAQDDLKAKEALIAAITEQNRLIAEQQRLMEEKPAAGGSGGGGGGRVGGIKPIAINWDAAFGDLDEKLANMQAAFASAWAAIITTLQPAIEAFGGVQLAFGNLVNAFAESAPRIQLYIADMVRFVVQELSVTLPATFNNLASALNSLADIWSNHGETIMSVVNFAFRFIVATVLSSMAAVSGFIAIILNTISGVWDTITLLMQGRWQEAFVAVAQYTLENMTIAQDTISAILNAILGIVNTNLNEFIATWTSNFNTAYAIVSAFFSNLISTWQTVLNMAGAIVSAFFANLVAIWTTNFTNLGIITSTILTSIQTNIMQALTNAAAIVASILSAIMTIWNNALSAVQTAMSNAMAAIQSAITGAQAAIVSAMTSVVAGLKSATEIDWGSIGSGIVAGMAGGVMSAAGGLASAAASAAANALAAAKRALGIRSPSKKAAELVGVPFVQGIAEGITSQIGSLSRTVQSASSDMLSSAASSVSYSSNYAPQFNYSPTYNSAPAPVSENFAIMRALAG